MGYSKEKCARLKAETLQGLGQGNETARAAVPLHVMPHFSHSVAQLCQQCTDAGGGPNICDIKKSNKRLDPSDGLVVDIQGVSRL